jgi:endo-alpha-1,4-polygalactosaminidase (GH114 family)
VTGWSHPPVAAAAAGEGLDPAKEMATLVRDLAGRARSLRPGFLVLLNDGAPLLAREPDLVPVVDGVVRESVSFSGRPSSRWDDPAGADLEVGAAKRRALVRELRAARDAGVAVLTLDYASGEEERGRAIRAARRHGFVPCVSRASLDRLPE